MHAGCDADNYTVRDITGLTNYGIRREALAKSLYAQRLKVCIQIVQLLFYANG